MVLIVVVVVEVVVDASEVASAVVGASDVLIVKGASAGMCWRVGAAGRRPSKSFRE